MVKALLLELSCPEVQHATHGESLSTDVLPERDVPSGRLNTPVLDGTERRSAAFQNKETFKSTCKKQGKGMSGVPCAV